jgi:hypothetical protein
VFTYYLKDDLQTKQTIRQEKEKKLIEKDKNVPFPGWDKLEQERRQQEPKIWLTVKDKQGDIVRRLEGPAKKGFHRISWDLRYPAVNPIELKEIDKENQPTGVLAAPGEYTVSMAKQVDGVVTDLSTARTFVVEPLNQGALKGATPVITAAFWQEITDLYRQTSAANTAIQNALKRMEYLKLALGRTTTTPGNLDKEMHTLNQELLELDGILNGNRAKRKIGEDRDPTILSRLSFAMGGTANSTYGPTPTHKKSFEIALKQFTALKSTLESVLNAKLPAFEKKLVEAGAPWVEGQPIPE